MPVIQEQFAHKVRIPIIERARVSLPPVRREHQDARLPDECVGGEPPAQESAGTATAVDSAFTDLRIHDSPHIVAAARDQLSVKGSVRKAGDEFGGLQPQFLTQIGNRDLV